MLLIVQNYHLVLWDSNLFFEVVQEENKTFTRTKTIIFSLNFL